jgi:hypothetical protein
MSKMSIFPGIVLAFAFVMLLGSSAQAVAQNEPTVSKAGASRLLPESSQSERASSHGAEPPCGCLQCPEYCAPPPPPPPPPPAPPPPPPLPLPPPPPPPPPSGDEFCQQNPGYPGCEYWFGDPAGELEDCWGFPDGVERGGSEPPDIIPCYLAPSATCPPEFPNCTCPSPTNGKKLTRVGYTYEQRGTGIDLWRATQLVFWCWNGTRITKIYRALRHWIAWGASLHWSYEGINYNSCDTEHCQEQAGDAQHPVRIVNISAKLHFRECLAFGIGVCQNKYPGVWLRISRGGARDGGIY